MSDWTHPKGPFPGVLDYEREYIAGSVIREACDHEVRGTKGVMVLTCSVGELAQRVVVALANHGASAASPKGERELEYVENIHRWANEDDAQAMWYCGSCGTGHSKRPESGRCTCLAASRMALILPGSSLEEVRRAFGIGASPDSPARPPNDAGLMTREELHAWYRSHGGVFDHETSEYCELRVHVPTLRRVLATALAASPAAPTQQDLQQKDGDVASPLAPQDQRPHKTDREACDDDALRMRLSDILTRTANALKGEPEPRHSHSWHDLPEVAAGIIQRRDAQWLKAIRDGHATPSSPSTPGHIPPAPAATFIERMAAVEAEHSPNVGMPPGAVIQTEQTDSPFPCIKCGRDTGRDPQRLYGAACYPNCGSVPPAAPDAPLPAREQFERLLGDLVELWLFEDTTAATRTRRGLAQQAVLAVFDTLHAAASRATPAAPQDAERLYYELLYAVANKYPGESRHETALRYIRQAEQSGSASSSSATKSAGLRAPSEGSGNEGACAVHRFENFVCERCGAPSQEVPGGGTATASSASERNSDAKGLPSTAAAPQQEADDPNPMATFEGKRGPNDD